MSVLDAPRPATTAVGDLELEVLCFVGAHQEQLSSAVSRTALYQYVRAAAIAQPFAEWVNALLRGGMADILASTVARMARHQLVRVSCDGYVLADAGASLLAEAKDRDRAEFELREKHVNNAIWAVRREAADDEQPAALA